MYGGIIMRNIYFYWLKRYLFFSLTHQTTAYAGSAVKTFDIKINITKLQTSAYALNHTNFKFKTTNFGVYVFKNSLPLRFFNVVITSTVFFFWQTVATLKHATLYSYLLQEGLPNQYYWCDNFFTQISVNFFFSRQLL